MANILVAGAGHGGLTAAGLLAAAGHTVTVLERNREEDAGHDWTDVFNPDCLAEAGIPMMPKGSLEPACNLTTFGPAKEKGVSSYIPPEECTEFSGDRKVLLRLLIAFAREKGARLRFGVEVLRPLTEGNRVTGLGLRDAGGDYTMRGDLVIDAAGIDSPVRTQLPKGCGILREFAEREYFNVFRAFYAKSGMEPLTEHPYSVYLYPTPDPSICWVVRGSDYVDMLYGRFAENSAEAGEDLRKLMSRLHPELGRKIVRGGQLRRIPVRRPIPMMVADGYAAIGDSAAMTVPVIGSGITNSIRAGRFLADTVLERKGFGVAELWPYQARYMREIGAVHASLDIFKEFLLGTEPSNLDFLIEMGVMNSRALIVTRTGQEIKFTPGELVSGGIQGVSRPELLAHLAGTLRTSRSIKRHCLRIPREYDKDAVAAWAEKYVAFTELPDSAYSAAVPEETTEPGFRMAPWAGTFN